MGTAINVFRGMGLIHEKNGVALSSHLKLELATMYFKRKLWNRKKLARRTGEEAKQQLRGPWRPQSKLHPVVILYPALKGEIMIHKGQPFFSPADLSSH